ncbi:MAG: hypothetical protein AAFN40_27755, partial [Cyanobacteria bacterium J06560_6]
KNMTMQKNRHGCLTAWLIFMMIGNALGLLVYLTSGRAIQQALPGAPDWIIPVLTVLVILNIIFTIALFLWKKWGFWGVVATSVAALVVNLAIGISPGQSILGLVGIAILYGVLNIGEDNKGWSQLE